MQIATDKNFTQNLSTHLVNDTQWVWRKARPGRFFWRVRSAHSPTRPFSSTGVIAAQLPAPRFAATEIRHNHRFMSPSNLRKKRRPLRIQWENGPTDGTYQIWISRRPNFKKARRFYSSSNALEFTLERSGTYYIKVSAIDEQKRQISAVAPPTRLVYRRELYLSTPKINSPEIDRTLASLPDKPLKFSWQAVPHAKHYRLEIAYDKDFKRPHLYRNVALTKFFLNRNFPQGVVYWRVRAEYEDSRSPWSALRTLRFSQSSAQD